jgi:hypothetical protein
VTLDAPHHSPDADADPDTEETRSLSLALVVGVALLVVAKLVPPAGAAVFALIAAAVVGALAGAGAAVAGALVGLPLAIGVTVLAFADSVGLGLLAMLAAASYLVVSAAAGAGGAVAVRSWFDRNSADPEARARARRGAIIIAVAVLLVGGPRAVAAITGPRADHEAARVRDRLVAAVRANLPLDGFVMQDEPAHPVYKAVPDAHVIATGTGANIQVDVRSFLSQRCVLVQVDGDVVTSRISHDACGPLVG